MKLLAFCLAGLVFVPTVIAQQTPRATVPQLPLQAGTVLPDNEPRKLEGEESILSLAAADKLLRTGQVAAQQNDFTLAVEKTTQAVTMLNQLSTFHESLAKSLSGIDNRISDEEKQLALSAAIKRDEASYQLAVIHRAQGKPELAVPLLVRIVASQGVDRTLGKQSWRQLYEMGFTRTPYPRT